MVKKLRTADINASTDIMFFFISFNLTRLCDNLANLISQCGYNRRLVRLWSGLQKLLASPIRNHLSVFHAQLWRMGINSWIVYNNNLLSYFCYNDAFRIYKYLIMVLVSRLFQWLCGSAAELIITCACFVKKRCIKFYVASF